MKETKGKKQAKGMKNAAEAIKKEAPRAEKKTEERVSKGTSLDKDLNFPLEFPVVLVLIVVLVVAVDLGIYLYNWGNLQENWWKMHNYQAQARDVQQNVLGAQQSRVTYGTPEPDKWRCVDSDYDKNADDKYDAGYAIRYGDSGNPKVVYDECSESGQVLYESVCVFEGNGEDVVVDVSAVERSCPNGCANGACRK